MSGEILDSIKILRNRKVNIETIIDYCSSISRIESIKKSVESIGDHSDLNTIRKVVEDSSSCVKRLPKDLFPDLFATYDKFCQKTSGILKSRLESHLKANDVVGTGNIAKILNVITQDFNIIDKYKAVFISNVQNKTEEIIQKLTSRAELYNSIQKIFESNQATHGGDFHHERLENNKHYPYIFLESLVEYLTMVYECISELKQSDFIVKNIETFKSVIFFIVNENMKGFIEKIYNKMNIFYNFSFKQFLKENKDLVITVQKPEKSKNVQNDQKSSEEQQKISYYEFYLDELMNMTA
jgi:hypothetical protein